MTEQTTHQPGFVLANEQGRTAQMLDVLGEKVLVKLANGDTNGAAAVFYLEVETMSGPPLHRHSREDEWFYVLEGRITVEVDGVRKQLGAGESAYAPRGTVHAFQNFESGNARMLVMVTPGGFQQFFEAVDGLNRGLAEPDMAGTVRLMNEYGMELMGPPLS